MSEMGNGAMQTNPVLELEGVTKRFAGITAVHDVSFGLVPGEVLCLLGDNGAGKSTLIKLLSGVHRPSEGSVRIDGDRMQFGSPREALAAGIATVHQDIAVMPLMSVARNFFLGDEPTKGRGPFRRIDQAKANELSISELRALGLTRVTDGGQLVGTLSGGEKQALAIGRAMYRGARILILDEPTSALGVKESQVVLRLIQRASASGVAVIFITHNVHHAMSVGARYVVLIHGEVAADFRKGERSRDEILDLMAGGEELEALSWEMEQGADPSPGAEEAR
jgi:simple sugar transport system ATP-binding protein